MTLRITDISLRNFRSYESFSIGGLGNLTIFVGPNASGKTNVIEAIQLLTSIAPFRNSTVTQLVRNGKAFAHAQIGISDGNRQLESRLELQEGSRSYFLNGKKKATKDMKGLLPAVTFTPDDLNMVKGGNKFRRHEIDVLGSQVNANYYQLMRDYEKVLRSKNHLLKEEDSSPEMLDAMNEVFSKVAAQLTNYREALFRRIAPYVSSHYEQIASNGEVLTAEYGKSYGEGESLAQAVQSRAQQEVERKRALVGPHLDTITFYIDGLDASSFASQGQQRSIVLAMKLAEADIIEEMMDQLPVLLLDDVMSELDEVRRSALVQKVLEGKQTFITTANIDYFDEDMLKQARLVRLGP